MKYKVIAGAISEFEVYAKDVISLKDTALAVKYDAVNKISSAMRSGKLQPYYFHKIRKNQHGEEVLSVYPFQFVEVWEYEYFKKVDAIFFLKRDVLNLELLENQEDILMCPQSNYVSEKSVEDVCLNIIRRSIEREKSYSLIYAVLYVFCTNITWFVFAPTYALKRMLNTIRRVSAVNGYTNTLQTETLSKQRQIMQIKQIDNQLADETFANEIIVPDNEKKIKKFQFNSISSLTDISTYLTQYSVTEHEQGQIINKLSSLKVATLLELAEVFKLESQSDKGKIQKAHRLNKSYVASLALAKMNKTVTNI